MKFTVNRKEFLVSLATARKVAIEKTTLPVLSNVVLTVGDNGTVACKASNLCTTVYAKVAATSCKAGAVTVNAKALADVVGKLDTEEVECQLMKNNRVQIKSENSTFRFVGLDAADFPETPSVPEDDTGEVVVPVEILRNLIKRSVFSVAQDSTRPHLSSVFFELCSDKLRMVSTDGHRLSKAEEDFASSMDEVSALIPKDGVLAVNQMISKVEGNCAVWFADGNMLFVGYENMMISIKCIDPSKFPPYDKVIPVSSSTSVVVSKSDLSSVLKRVAVFSDLENGSVVMSFSSKGLLVTSENESIGDAREVVQCDYDGPEINVGVSAAYVKDCLGCIETEEVSLSTDGAVEPFVVQPVDDDCYLGIVMPVRL